MSIELLVAEGPASVRLSNAIGRGAIEGLIPCATVGDYLDAGPAAASMFMNALWSFGRRTASELDALVAKRLADALLEADTCTPAAAPPPVIASERDLHLEELVTRLKGLTYADALKGQAPSARLANALANHDLGTASVVELLMGGSISRASLLHTPNLGRVSLQEFEALCRAAVIRALAKDCDDQKRLFADCSLLFGIEIESPEALALEQQILDTLQSGPPRDCDLGALLSWGMLELSERELEILSRRYGLDGRPAQTLEEISAGYAVTRERVRQLEAKALRRIRGKLAGHLLAALVDEESKAFWSSRRDPFVFLTARDSNRVRRELPPKLLLALDVLHLSIAAWLEQSSTAMSNGYLSRSVDAKQVQELGVLLMERLGDQPLPVAVRDLIDADDPMILEAAFCLETPYTLFESYVLHAPPRARLKRAVRLHALLSSLKRPQTLYQLGDLYSEQVRSDECSLRDLVIVMELSPQLFLEIEDGLWVALGRGGEPIANTQIDAEPASPSDVDQTTIAGSLQEALRARGPSLVGDLYRDAATVLPVGRSRNSIAPVLVGRPELFLRILPGVYSLMEQLPSPAELLRIPLPYWLTEAQGRTYSFARFAGEPWGIFPLWIPAAEYRLCAWARFEGSPALFHSLLAIAQIDAWPIDYVQKDEWRRLAAQLARFELEVSGKAPIRELRPELDRLLAACRIAIERGSINWIQVNRIIGRRLDAAGGQGLLALLIALGAVSPPANDIENQRLRPHPVTPQAADIAQRIEAEIVRHGETTWSSTLGQALAADAVSADPAQLGWASLEQLAELLETEPAEQFGSTVDGEEDEDDLITRLMREHRSSVEQDRRDKAAQWLLEA
jgi:Sigma-70, region 4